MADPVIRLKRSAVAGKRPTLANLELGELALNTYDSNLFTRQDTGGVGIGTTVTLLTPWQESYGAASISYDGDVNVTGVITASDGRLIAGVGISSEGTYIGSGITAFNFVGGGVSSVTVPSAGFSTVTIDFGDVKFTKNVSEFTATEGQTIFNKNYVPENVEVFLNGVRLNSDNYTATDGSTVALSTSTSAGDAVDIISYESFSSTTPKRIVTNITASAGQTSFTVPVYDTGTNSMDVYLNGIKLDPNEFVETNNTTVTLSSAAALNDELQFISYESDNNFWSLSGNTLYRTNSIDGNVGIGTTIAGRRFHVNGGIRNTSRNTPSTQTALHINTTTGDIAETASSRRFKKNIKNYDKGIETLIKLRPVSYNFIDDDLPNSGLIAEEVSDIGLTEFIRYDKNGDPYSIPYDNLSALYINSIKNLKNENDLLKLKIEELNARLDNAGL